MSLDLKAVQFTFSGLRTIPVAVTSILDGLSLIHI